MQGSDKKMRDINICICWFGVAFYGLGWLHCILVRCKRSSRALVTVDSKRIAKIHDDVERLGTDSSSCPGLSWTGMLVMLSPERASYELHVSLGA